MSQHQPMFNVPSVVVAVAALLVGVHVIIILLPTAWGSWLTEALAFIPARFAGYAEVLPGGPIASVTSFLTHTLVHGDVVHLMFNAAWLVVFGGAVAMRIGAIRFVLFFVFCAVAGALTFLILNPGLMAPVVGASGAISGLMGGTMRFLFSALDHGGIWLLREAPQRVPLMSISQMLKDRRVLAVSGIFILMNVLAMFGFGGVVAGGIAWEAHLGGYFAGLVAFGFFEPKSKVHSLDKKVLH
ncbi:MAG: rhomboid family intramembrane serine protease [Hyphomicrobium sp.]